MSNSLNGFKVVDGVPGKKGYSKWQPRETVGAFIETGNKAMAKDYGNDSDAKLAYLSFRWFIKDKGDIPAMVVRRGTKVFLVRTDLGE